MGLLRGTVLGAISALYLATAAPAQEGGEGTLQVPGILYAGTEVTISYSNEEFADKMVFVAVSDEAGGEGSESVLIYLDGNGDGDGILDVPEEWSMAYFNAPSTGVVIRPVSAQN